MLAIQPAAASKPRKLVPNLLPASIHHNGPIPISPRHWDPQPQEAPSGTESPQAQSQAQLQAGAPQPASSDGRGAPQVAYLRGRRLLGRRLALPAGYEGAVVQRTATTVSVPPRAQGKDAAGNVGGGERGFGDAHGLGMDEDENDEDDDGEDREAHMEPAEAKLMERVAQFDEIVVWGHEHVPADDDAYVKGLTEWVDLAHAVSRRGEEGLRESWAAG